MTNQMQLTKMNKKKHNTYDQIIILIIKILTSPSLYKQEIPKSPQPPQLRPCPRPRPTAPFLTPLVASVDVIKVSSNWNQSQAATNPPESDNDLPESWAKFAAS